ncbi:MAG: hypothetical protein COV71_01185 [Candidatus Omnitrophica bacterium CG11_big_fil_rev_8_21_14_0_20_41_12]|nr:MAG: hypothetical protein COV71_01185 [Candidatus Omnitrophica bacterium CG11_big_fil_rev_8_21_14_0_20_41_12]
MPDSNKKGVILFIVLGVIMVSVLLATVVLRIISSQSRLTHHNVTRIQAQYAAKAGFLYAFDKLRRGDAVWSATTPVAPVIKRMCKQAGPGCNIIESDLPISIQYVDITVYDPAAVAPNQGINGTRKITAKATYTYIP